MLTFWMAIVSVVVRYNDTMLFYDTIDTSHKDALHCTESFVFDMAHMLLQLKSFV